MKPRGIATQKWGISFSPEIRFSSHGPNATNDLEKSMEATSPQKKKATPPVSVKFMGSSSPCASPAPPLPSQKSTAISAGAARPSHAPPPPPAKPAKRESK